MGRGKGRGAPRRSDVFMNRYRGEIVVPAASTTLVQVTFNTGMNLGAGDKRKWIVYGFALAPKKLAPIGLSATAMQVVCAQLCIGTPTDLLDYDDVQLICQANRSVIMTTQASQHVEEWPLRAYVPYPIPVFANQLTVQFDALEDVASLNGETLGFQIDYLTAGVADGEIAEFFQAYGGL